MPIRLGDVGSRQPSGHSGALADATQNEYYICGYWERNGEGLLWCIHAMCLIKFQVILTGIQYNLNN